MMHSLRRFQVSDVQDANDLSRLLTEHTWCGCIGFRLGSLIFLNDSTCGDGAQEYAVFRGDRQIESITMSWCTREQAFTYIVNLLAGGGCDWPKSTRPVIETPKEHGQCHLCA